MGMPVAERREKAESHTGEYNTMQYLQKILRKDFSPESLASNKQKENCARLLIQKAKDYDMKVEEEHSYDYYHQLAYSAISRFINNWEGKEHGDSPIGKTSLGQIANSVASML